MSTSFAITTSSHLALELDHRRRATVAFTVSNLAQEPVDATASAVPGDGAQAAWFEVTRPTRQYEAGGTEQVAVALDIPQDAPAGTYSFALSVDDTGDMRAPPTESEPIQFVVPEPVARPKSGMPSWLIFAIGGAVLLVGIIATVVVLATSGGREPGAPEDDTDARSVDSQPLELAPGFTPYGGEYVPPTVTVDGSRVSLTGLVRGSFGHERVIATLPQGMVPAGRLIFATGVGGQVNRVDVLPDGQVRWVQAPDARAGWVSLAGVSYVIDPGAPLELGEGYKPYGHPYLEPRATVSDGLVTLSGLVRTSDHTPRPFTAQPTLARLPEGMRPPGVLLLALDQHQFSLRVDVNPEGELRYVAGTTAYDWVSLSGISFRVIDDGLEPLPLGEGFGPYGEAFQDPSVYFDGQRVYLSGLLRLRGAPALTGAVLATLPPGRRPAGRLIFPASHHERALRLDVYSTGEIRVSGSPRLPWVSLSNVAFYPASAE